MLEYFERTEGRGLTSFNLHFIYISISFVLFMLSIISILFNLSICFILFIWYNNTRVEELLTFLRGFFTTIHFEVEILESAVFIPIILSFYNKFNARVE